MYHANKAQALLLFKNDIGATWTESEVCGVIEDLMQCPWQRRVRPISEKQCRCSLLHLAAALGWARLIETLLEWK